MKSSKLSLLSLLLAVGTGTMSPDQAKATLDGMQDKDLRSAHSFVNALGGKQPRNTESIRQAISQTVCSERDWAIMSRRLIDGIHIEPLAEEFELSPRQVCYIVKRYKPLIMANI